MAPERITGAVAFERDWFLADGSAGTISRVDSVGRFVWTVGRLGRGPDEYLSIRLLGVRDSGLAVYDAQQRKLRVLSLRDGHRLGESILRFQPQYYSSDVLAMLPSGEPLVRAATLDYRSHIGVVRPEAVLLVGDSIHGTTEIGRYRESELIREIVELKTYEVLRPLGRRSGVASCRNKVWTFDGDSLFEIEGGPSKWQKISVPLPARPKAGVAGHQRDAWVQGEFPELGKVGDPVGTILRRHLDTRSHLLWGQGGVSFEAPLLCSDDGAIFLRAFTADEPQRWWRRSSDGSWKEISLTSGAEAIAFGASTALIRITSDIQSERVALLHFQ